MNNLQTVYPVCCRLLETIPELPADQLLDLGDFLDQHPEYLRSHPYLSDLARIEAARYLLAENPSPLPCSPGREVNPNLTLIEVQWLRLPEVLNHPAAPPPPLSGYGFVLVWQQPGTSTVEISEADAHDLLALKIVSDRIDSRAAAKEGKVSVGAIDDILARAERKGLLLAPESLLVRPAAFHRGEITDPQFFTTPTFTLQWHITQTCDLRCRHCYDRSERPEPELDYCIQVLDQLYDFSQAHNVFIQVTFTGGNPLLYPHFNELYREAADRGFMTAVLGNPMPGKRIEEMLAVQKPEFYQVSLEGLRDHNDYIRGPGHYDRVIDFLKLLRELDIYSMVMLTLTRENMNQVIALGEQLRGLVDRFTFNRLAMVGEGADLASASREEYPDFLRKYVDAAQHNPCLGLKDNLFNILRHERQQPYFGGCAGRGCGAAFNFMALLPDGEVHACRKFPSLIGNLAESGLSEIYHGEPARRYRQGSQACSLCAIRPVCGGCLAVAHGFGLDIFTDRDPYCFIDPLHPDHD